MHSRTRREAEQNRGFPIRKDPYIMNHTLLMLECCSRARLSPRGGGDDSSGDTDARARNCRSGRVALLCDFDFGYGRGEKTRLTSLSSNLRSQKQRCLRTSETTRSHGGLNDISLAPLFSLSFSLCASLRPFLPPSFFFLLPSTDVTWTELPPRGNICFLHASPVIYLLLY